MEPDWVDRVSESIRCHEDERRESRKALPRYEILEELGRGGMAVVYRAWDPELDRQVALKILQQGLGTSPEMRERFFREAQIASRLEHPNIVAVYDVGEWEGQGYLAMRLVEGATLGKADLDLRGKLAALRDAARALHHAHRQGIIHRDVKPSNLLVDHEGCVFVSDFGVARRIDVPSKLTLTGVTVGTPAYISPEQARGSEVDPRSDVYALGASMYEIVSGCAPFSGADALKVMVARLTEDPDPPSRHCPGLSRAVDKIVAKAMEREPEHRYASAGEFADDIQRYLDGEPIFARPAPLRFRTRRFIVRHGWRVATVALLCVLLAGTAYVGMDYLEARRQFALAETERDLLKKLEHNRAAIFWFPAARKRIVEIEAEIRRLIRETLKRGNLEEVAVYLGRVPGEFPDLEFELGLAQLEQEHDHDTFSKLLDKLSVADQPDRDKRLSGAVARFALEQEDPHEVVEWVTRAEALGAKEWRLYRNRARARWRLKDLKGASVDYREYIKKCPGSEVIPREFGALLVKVAREFSGEDALELLDEAVAVDDAHAPAYHDRGLARYRTSGDALAAMKDLEGALARDKGLAPAPEYSGIGLALAKGIWEENWKSDNAEARDAAWEESIRWLSMAPKSDDVYLELARMQRRLRRYGRALKMLEGVFGNPELHLVRGQILYLQNRQTEAKAELEKSGNALWRVAGLQALNPELKDPSPFRLALEAGCRSAELHLRMAILLANTGKFGEAAEASTRALEAAPALDEEGYVLRLGEHRRLSHAEVVRELQVRAFYMRAYVSEGPARIRDCSASLKLDPRYGKAYALRAKARCDSNAYAEALEDCVKAEEFVTDPKLREKVKRLKTLCEERSRD